MVWRGGVGRGTRYYRVTVKVGQGPGGEWGWRTTQGCGGRGGGVGVGAGVGAGVDDGGGTVRARAHRPVPPCALHPQDNGGGMPHKDIPNMLGRVLSGTKYGAPLWLGVSSRSCSILAWSCASLCPVARAAENARRPAPETAPGVKQTRGKFGLGAKMALIWSKMTTGLPFSITSAMRRGCPLAFLAPLGHGGVLPLALITSQGGMSDDPSPSDPTCLAPPLPLPGARTTAAATCWTLTSTGGLVGG